MAAPLATGDQAGTLARLPGAPSDSEFAIGLFVKCQGRVAIIAIPVEVASAIGLSVGTVTIEDDDGTKFLAVFIKVSLKSVLHPSQCLPATPLYD